MKNVKMILTAVAVFAVVGGALAFKPNYIRTFCASTSQDSGCAIQTKKIGTGTANYFQYTLWDGTSGDCLTNRCHDAVNLIDN